MTIRDDNMIKGIVLDAETAAVVPDLSTIRVAGESNTTFIKWMRQPLCGDILTHIGGRPVTELVAEADQAEADAKWCRMRGRQFDEASTGWASYHALAARIDERRANAIDARLVAAAHAQWADAGGCGR